LCAGSPFGQVYTSLLERERGWNKRDDRIAANMMAKDRFCLRRDRRLTELLEAGKPLIDASLSSRRCGGVPGCGRRPLRQSR
jgi:hypothetical protein